MKQQGTEAIVEFSNTVGLTFPITPIIRSGIDLFCNEFYIKRDDLLPYSFGGNKVRIANEFFRDMSDSNGTCLIGYGNARSNLVRALAWICKRHEIKCYIVSPYDGSDDRLDTFNQRIAVLSGATIISCKKTDVAHCIEKLTQELICQGERPYYIHGNNQGTGNLEVPVSAYVDVYNELLIQQKELDITFDYLFLACGTGMTLAGLQAGRFLAGGKERIIGISVARRSEVASLKVRQMVTQYIKKLRRTIIEEWYQDNLLITDDYLAGGYGLYNQDILDCIVSELVQEGMPLDPTYTGKAFWGMLSFIKQYQIKEKRVLFIHTGGMPLFFDNISFLTKGE